MLDVVRSVGTDVLSDTSSLVGAPDEVFGTHGISEDAPVEAEAGLFGNEAFESRNDFPRTLENHVEHQREFVPQVVSDAERYRNEAVDLHVHFLFGEEEWCAVLNGGSKPRDFDTLAENAGSFQGWLGENQSPALVG